MNNGHSVISEEVSNSKVAAIFPSETEAREEAIRLRAELGLGEAQVQVLTPHDRTVGRKLEPESRGIFRTMLWAHAKLGVLGAIVGVLAFVGLWLAKVQLIVDAAPAAFGAFLFFGAIAGLMLGGLVTLRPDHDPYIVKVEEALRKGHSAVVVHAFSHEQRTQALHALEATGRETVSTII